MKVSERRSRVCKAVMKAKGGYFDEAKIENIVILQILFSRHHSQDVSTIEKVVKIKIKTIEWRRFLTGSVNVGVCFFLS